MIVEKWPITCPSCGSIIKLVRDQREVACRYCSHSVSVETWLEMGKPEANPTPIQIEMARIRRLLSLQPAVFTPSNQPNNASQQPTLVEQEVKLVRLEQQLSRLEHRWQADNQMHSRNTLYGPNTPSYARVIMAGVVAVGVFILLLFMQPGLFLFCAAIFPLLWMRFELMRVESYENELNRYLIQRNEIKRKIRTLQAGQKRNSYLETTGRCVELVNEIYAE